jgi:hypothetical protein
VQVVQPIGVAGGWSLRYVLRGDARWWVLADLCSMLADGESCVVAEVLPNHSRLGFSQKADMRLEHRPSELVSMIADSGMRWLLEQEVVDPGITPLRRERAAKCLDSLWAKHNEPVWVSAGTRALLRAYCQRACITTEAAADQLLRKALDELEAGAQARPASSAEESRGVRWRWVPKCGGSAQVLQASVAPGKWADVATWLDGEGGEDEN